MGRYRKSNGEHLLETVAWCFEGSPERAAGAAAVSLAVFCFAIPSMLPEPTMVLAGIVKTVGIGSICLGAGLSAALLIAAAVKWYREAA